MKKFEELRKMSNVAERKEWLGKMTKSELISYYEQGFDKKISATFLNSKKKVEIVQAILTLFDNIRRGEAFDNMGKKKSVESCPTPKKNVVENPTPKKNVVENPTPKKNVVEKRPTPTKKAVEIPTPKKNADEKNPNAPKIKFEELRKLSNNAEVRAYLEKMSKPQLISYYESQFDKKISASYLKSKTKEKVVESVMNFYDTIRRSEAMENIIV
jgi:hypothetical protein